MATQHQAPDASPAGQEPRRPPRLKSLLLLALILVVGTGLRLREIADPLQQDEFGPLYAVVEREGTVPGYTASAEMPLRPVKSWAEVRERSIFPYGIKSPFPLYHYILYAFVHVLPINEVTLRLPSLLAGLGVIVTMYWLARTVAGTDAGLAAALLTAVEPMQISISRIARPYALATLAVILSCLALHNLLTHQQLWRSALCAVIYSLCIAFIGYMNPMLLLVLLPQAVFALLWMGRTVWQQRSWRPALRPCLWLAVGGALAGALMYPQWEYVREVRNFNSTFREFLNWYIPPRGVFLYLHNVVIFGASVAGLVAGAIAYGLFGRRNRDDPAGSAVAPAGFTDLSMMGLLVLIVPQVFVSLADSGTNRSMCLSRYLVYTQLGWIMLYTSLLVKTHVAISRWSALLAASLVLTILGRFDFGRGIQLETGNFMMDAVVQFLELEDQSHVRNGDALLVRSGFLESDVRIEKFPEQSRSHLRGVSVAPLHSLYSPKKIRPYNVLGLSHRYGIAWAGNPLLREQEYVKGVSALELNGFRRFWILDWGGGKDPFAQCLLPRLANILNSDLRVARDPAAGRFDFEIPRDIKPGDYIPALHDPSAQKFGPLILVERKPD